MSYLYPAIEAAMLIAAFWMGYLVGVGVGVRLALRAARHDFADEERRRARYETAAPWARALVERLAQEAGVA